MQPEIILDSVNSSQLHAIGHDPATNTLAIQFKSKAGPGSIYHYSNFTAEKFAEFKAAESIGKYFGAHIKNAEEEHPWVKIDAPVTSEEA